VNDRILLERAVALALANEADGGLPVAAVIALDGEIVAEGASCVAMPSTGAPIERLRCCPAAPTTASCPRGAAEPVRPASCSSWSAP
jgi:hypothetical protein